jgi:hypothetical protein
VKVPLLRDVPPRAAAVVVSLALAASIVTATPWTPKKQSSAEPPAPAVEPRPDNQAQPLDLQSLERRKASGTVPDLFINPAPATQPATSSGAIASTAPSPPPAPTAPALPFKYLGRLDDEERRVVFLENGQNLYSVGVGDALDGAYRIEAVTETSVSFRHLSMDVVQTLAIPKAP